MTAAVSVGLVNSGSGPSLTPWDIGHKTHVVVIGADTAFWALVPKVKLAEVLARGSLLDEYRQKEPSLSAEMNLLRFGLKPSCVYFNPTERCNLNCSYCYLPSDLRKNGRHMSTEEVLMALESLKSHFSQDLARKRRPQVVFHGAEPLLNREAVFAGIKQYSEYFSFGVQTNASLLDESAIEFLKDHRVGIGLSLDGPEATISNLTRQTWAGKGVHDLVITALKRLQGYPNYNVITTITKSNVKHLTTMVEVLHGLGVKQCMLNAIRCTMPGATDLRASDAEVAKHYLAALERSHELYVKTGQKLVVVNFANALLAIVAPTARRQMCDISPCGAGRSFFAVAATGDLYPCSEFIGLPAFRGGNLYHDPIEDVLQSKNFRAVSERKVEDIHRCKTCAIRHFCGAPCPAEANELNGGTCQLGGYCGLYEEQIRHAFRVIADQVYEDYLWDDWDNGMTLSFGQV